MAEEEIMALLKAIREEQQATSAKLDRLETKLDRLETKFERLETKVDVLTEGLGALRVTVQDLEDRVEMLHGSVIRLDGKGVEATALYRMLERHDQRIKAVKERTKQ